MSEPMVTIPLAEYERLKAEARLRAAPVPVRDGHRGLLYERGIGQGKPRRGE